MVKERNTCKEKCDRIKSNIRLNRQKFNKSVEEFGTDKSLDLDDSQSISGDQRASQASVNKHGV